MTAPIERSLTVDEPTGTFACPICGTDKPHCHTEGEQKAYHEEQLRGQPLHADGWIRSDLQMPKERGWYLCRGVEIEADQYGKPADFWDHHPRWSQISWFLWVRAAANQGYSDSQIPEVLYFDPMWSPYSFTLRNFLGNAVPSGAESRHRVVAHAKYWRQVPAFQEAKR